LLLAMLVVGSAFMRTPEKTKDVHMVRIFDASKITDDETQGGGNPNAPSDVTPAPAPPPIPQPSAPVVQEPPIQTPPTPKVTIVEPPPEPKPKKRTPRVEAPKPDPIKQNETPKIVKNPNSTRVVPKKNLVEKPPEIPKPQHQIEVNVDTIKKATADPNIEKQKQERLRAEREERRRQERERQEQERLRQEAIDQANRDYKQRMAALGTIVGNVENRMSSGVAVEMPPGDGNQAFVNYADLLWSRYYQAWQTPEARDVRSPVKVEIVVSRDGRVISANIVKPSGDAQLDKSVRQALDRVSKLPPFPEGAKDPQRTFRINFELKSKRQFG
jgi:TonB family protein